MSLLKLFNEEKFSEKELQEFTIRIATRAIIQDSDGNIAILYSHKFNYHEIPGGAVDEGETIEEGFVRECLEETGCSVKIIKKIGVTQEVRGNKKRINESHCFLAQVIGEKGQTQFEEDEIEENFELLWFPPKKAYELIKAIPYSDNLYTRYVKDRALLFIEKSGLLDE